MNVGMSFQVLDLVVALVIVLSTIYAIYRGFVNETLAIFAWAAAALATLYFGPMVARLLYGSISPAWLGSLIGYAGVFLMVVIPLSFLSFRMSQNVKKSSIGPLDRSLGAVFGVLRGLAVLGILYIVFTAIVPVWMQPGWVTKAYSLSLVQISAEVISSLVPERPGEKRAPPARPAKAEPDQPRADGIGDLIRTMPEGAEPQAESKVTRQKEQRAAKKSPEPADATRRDQKTYGAQDRQALDNLIENSNDGKNGKP